MIQRYTFGKTEKLCSKRSFDLLFEARKAFYTGSLQTIYLLDHPDELATSPLMVAFAVPKRNFKRAVTRNLLKRRMREAYRLNKHHILAVLEGKSKKAACLFKYNAREIRSFNDIAQDMERALQKLARLL